MRQKYLNKIINARVYSVATAAPLDSAPLMNFLTHMGEPRNINLFYYRNHGSAYGRVLCCIKVPKGDAKAFQSFLHTLGYPKIPRDRQSRVLDFPQRCLVRPFARILLFIFLSFPAHADEAAWRALEIPGTFALMRHALAPGTGDPAEVRIGDCTTQRNLNAARTRSSAADRPRVPGAQHCLRCCLYQSMVPLPRRPRNCSTWARRWTCLP